MPGRRIDATDRRILAELQAQGDLPNAELARRVGLSPAPCLRRVRALEQAGYLRGCHAVLDPERLGYGVQVFAQVRLISQAEADLRAFEARAAGWPMVRECHMLNGETDFLLRCVAPDLPSFQRFLTESLTPAPNVASVRTSLVIRSAKVEPLVPIEA
ncbi:transcriptional regulator, AsnC family [Rubellimicrobium thermophilum DSM 16684]|uniref:Transcriptional regulator, AsnC family n=1 Tax=Rubellimicrobium thermophilum DSM 16684 TaxID=1123069 RepID=S9R611_9RHOB|nr:Lrp/AsnC family transcriptional regulator [Rubellimicrobium thermophilum]EPX87342.1 transcriptional regulator, AsnC family [Rubellimicrobium thermophilum DSM 16684]